MSGLKLIFNWKTHCMISIKLLFKSAATSLLSTLENKQVSLVNNLGLQGKPSGKSLMQTRIKRKQRIESCGTPATTSLQDEYWRFTTTLCFLEP